MHHFIFCKKDSLIYNDESIRSKNFGLDPCIEIGCVNKLSRTFKTSSLILMNEPDELINRYVYDFTGTFRGNIYCSTGSISGSVYCNCEPTNLIDDDDDQLIEDDGDEIIP